MVSGVASGMETRNRTKTSTKKGSDKNVVREMKWHNFTNTNDIVHKKHAVCRGARFAGPHRGSRAAQNRHHQGHRKKSSFTCEKVHQKWRNKELSTINLVQSIFGLVFMCCHLTWNYQTKDVVCYQAFSLFNGQCDCAMLLELRGVSGVVVRSLIKISVSLLV